MPAGTSLTRYVGGLLGALLSMFAGAQTVHLMYNPLQVSAI